MPLLDTLISHVDSALKTIAPPSSRQSLRTRPDNDIKDAPLSTDDQKHIAGLVRVNHAGEVCAQALYQGQALSARRADVKRHMQEAALEEIDHLAWCESRLQELNSQPSIFNPIWYLGSFAIGALAGALNDKISLGFVAETERQVGLHLQQHLEKCPTHDKKTQVILKQMQEDEKHHEEQAKLAGAIDFPAPVKTGMHWVSRIMTNLSYYY